MYEDTIDYFPTPAELAEEMVNSIAIHKRDYAYAPGPILEPSAGTGNLVNAMEKIFCRHGHTKVDVDCVEISANCRAILKKDGWRVVHDDFMTFEPQKRYKAIVMNPPFSSGVKHLLRAIKIMERGGAIRCILGAETVRNPHTNEQRELVRVLKQMDAQIEYRRDAFLSSERPTGVEIALISLDIPEKAPNSHIRMELEQAYDEYSTYNQNNLVSNDPVAAVVSRYKVAAQGLRRIFEEYDGIRELLSAPTNEAKDPVVALGKSYNEAIQELRLQYWRALFDIPVIRDNLTETMRQEYTERLEELSNYDFTMFNILTIRQEIAANTVAGIKSEIIKLFERFTSYHCEEFSGNIHYFNGWRTNSAYKVNERIVFPCNAYCSWMGYTFEPTYYNVVNTLSNIELTLHYLDTSGTPYDATELRDILRNAQKEKKSRKINCRYFDVTFYKKGTCHLTFTNLDVLRAFNAFACREKGWLPPAYGQKTYESMSAEERNIVDNYEGKAVYTDSFNRRVLVTTPILPQLNA